MKAGKINKIISEDRYLKQFNERMEKDKQEKISAYYMENC